MSDMEDDVLAEINFATSDIPCASTISGRDLQGLDRIVSFFEAIGPFTDCDLYDDAWNLRNHMVPFKPGDEHYDPEGDPTAPLPAVDGS